MAGKRYLFIAVDCFSGLSFSQFFSPDYVKTYLHRMDGLGSGCRLVYDKGNFEHLILSDNYPHWPVGAIIRHTVS